MGNGHGVVEAPSTILRFVTPPSFRFGARNYERIPSSNPGQRFILGSLCTFPFPHALPNLYILDRRRHRATVQVQATAAYNTQVSLTGRHALHTYDALDRALRRRHHGRCSAVLRRDHQRPQRCAEKHTGGGDGEGAEHGRCRNQARVQYVASRSATARVDCELLITS
jgi:hypothetical protein